MDIHDRIKDLRHAQHKTLEDIARVVGVSKSTVRKWEAGDIKNMRRDKIAKLAEALDTSPEYLMGWPSSPSLTADEQALLDDYRALNRAGKEYVRQTMAMARQTYSVKSK